MSQTLSPRHQHFILNTDHRPHPLANTLTLITACLGTIAVISAGFPSLHMLAGWTGATGLAVGLWAQMVSATTAGRFVNATAMIFSGLGLLFGLGHGGLY
jgi:hypothetical protein